MARTKEKTNEKIEDQYQEVFKFIQTNIHLQSENSSLAQPMPYESIPTLVTYGAYEEPILGNSGEN